MAAGPAAIRTPDQRVRVFVSSTLKELAPERQAVRGAIEQLRLAPVMFELGARPHPPRDLYRSYLAQSDVFVGIYGESYGWVAPGEQISGLEEEYRLAGDLPSLIYIKQPAPGREERLTELLDRIRSDDRSSWKSFSTPKQLAALVGSDLATLMAERFVASRIAESMPPSPPPSSATTEIPAPYTAIVGRERERAEVAALLSQAGTRLVTLVGPGGIGKSRLAIEIAMDAASSGRDVAFALLEAVPTPAGALVAIARALGVRNAQGGGTLKDKVVLALAERDMLLVVDNMEHLLDATDLLVDLLMECPRLTMLVTSRSPLRVRAEHLYDVGPLDLPAESAGGEAASGSAVDLFVERAAAVRPGFTLTADNVDSVIAICRAVDGVPLAIELAAARMRSLSASQILARLDSALTLLVGGARDLPERQRALRSTIQWSTDLLEPEIRAALASLSVFIGSFSLASAERVLTDTGIEDPFGALDALVDASLLSTSDRYGVTMFRQLSLVRAFAADLLTPEHAAAAAAAWLANYRDLAAEAEPALRGAEQLEWLHRLERETENLARVTRVLFDRRDLDDAAAYFWDLYLYLWIGGYLGVVRNWADELLAIAEREQVPIAPRTRAIAEYFANAVRFWQEPGYDVVPGLTLSRDLFTDAGDEHGAAVAGISIGLAQLSRAEPDVPAAVGALEASRAGFAHEGDAWGQAMVLNVLGRVNMAGGDMAAARELFEESLRLATAQGERLGIVIAMNSRGWTRLLSGDLVGGEDDFAQSLDLSLALRHDEGIAYGLEAFAGLRALQSDPVAAGRLLGAAQRLRRRKGLVNLGTFEWYMIPVGALRSAGAGEALDAAIAEGLELTVAEVLDHVRS